MASNNKQFSCADYHVAWICPVTNVELGPALLMLDEKHSPPTYDTHYDENTYIFGTIAGHAVVIATCPQGETGNVNAGRLTGSMFKTFPNIRMAVLVGIGGGIPRPTVSENPLDNIHLGDVVVGWPGDGKPACVYHDRGKSKVDGKFEMVGTMQNPDWRLTNALGVLATEAQFGRTTLDDQLARLQKYKQFAHPGLEHDRLFRATYHHIGEYGSNCVACDQNGLIQRPQRTEDDKNKLVFHQGRIATVNSVIQDGELRDQIGARCGRALCVEMEAAGVDVNRRCLIIRGISDYADSHKNDVWRSHAAGNAAAFTRELLYRIQPDEARNVERIAEGNHPYWTQFILEGVPWTDKFVDRPSEMAELERVLLPESHNQRQKLFFLHGLGGIGKTQLAAGFARRYSRRFSSVFWLDGSSRVNLERSFFNVAMRLPRGQISTELDECLRLRQEKMDMGAVRGVIQWLCLPANQAWLLIFDNVDRHHPSMTLDPSAYDVARYFPLADHGSILVTSRLSSLTHRWDGLEVRKLEDLAQSMLEKYAGKPLTDASLILPLLDGLPLALAQAGTYLRETNMEVSTYVKHYRQRWESLMTKQDQFPLEQYKRPMLATWEMSYEQIRSQDPGTADLLKLWAFLDNRDLWYDLIASAPVACTDSDILKSLREVTKDELERADAFRLLSRYSLVSANTRSLDSPHEDAASYSMHSVLHQWCSRLSVGQEKVTFLGYAAILVASLVPSEDRSASWKLRRRLLPHSNRVYRWIIELQENSDGASDHIRPWVFTKLGDLFASQDKLEESEWMHRRALERYKKELGAEDILALDTAKTLGNIYMSQGKLGPAEKIYQEALKGMEKTLGTGHMSTLNTVNNLGNLYARQGKLDEAEEMLRRALDGNEKTLGTAHVSTLGIVNNLGSLYKAQGRLGEAEVMYQQALEGRKKNLGIDHQMTLQTIHNLGTLFKEQGRLDKAEKMYRQALDGKKKVLGHGHTSTLTTIDNLGNLYAEQGKLDEAKELFLRALEGKEKALGTAHISTLGTVNNLGSLYVRQGKPGKAENMFRRALGGYERTLNPQAISRSIPALDAAYNLGILLVTSHEADKARELISRALEGYQQVLGNDHSKCQQVRERLNRLDELAFQRQLGSNKKAKRAHTSSQSGEGLGHRGEASTPASARHSHLCARTLSSLGPSRGTFG
ncbi:Pfs, NB-ARC and TPR domain protein [Dactylonectria estremocensis]|uniref:Pfs, NB-ARC and TPR domain protein n=1 Tax=Dactylonectria estremocensis TaxID=1079267 RepID=A0A9P9EUI9_9HYPO|nr:Pfs, NB-ARC and TPR domain protein [Dactylonectria estremocensis]